MIHYNWVILHAISYVVSYHRVVLCFTHCKSAWIDGICYSWSKSIDSKKVRNESRCFVIRSCLLAGQCPAFMAFFFIVCLCVSSRVQW